MIASLKPEERKSLALNPLSKKNQALIRRAGAHVPGLGSLAGSLYEAFVLERFLRLPKTYRKRLDSFVDASGVKKKTAWLSLYQPDMLMVLAASTNDAVRNRFLQGMPACSTTTIQGGDNLYFFRNLDYPAASCWERNPAVFYHEPTEPEFQKFLSVASLGIDTAGLTGWNESGIAVSLHAHFSKKISLKGVPIFFLLEEILEQDRTIEEAIARCKKFKTIGSWAINITSFKEKKAVTVELANGSSSVQKAEACGLPHANNFQSPDFKKTEIHFSGAVFDDSTYRRQTLEEATRSLKLPAQFRDALGVLGSHVDPSTNQERIFGNTISVVTTIQSVAFNPQEDALYISTRDETPTGLGPYLKLPFDFSKLDPNAEPELVTIPKQYGEEFLKALHLYYQAYVSWQVRNEGPDVALSYLIQATEALGSDPHLQMQRGYFEMMEGQYSEALKCFETALKKDLSQHLYQVALYFRAACHDLLGSREKAIHDYQTILNFKTVDEKLGKKARKRLNSAYKTSYCKRIEPDLQFVEPINYR